MHYITCITFPFTDVHLHLQFQSHCITKHRYICVHIHPPIYQLCFLPSVKTPAENAGAGQPIEVDGRGAAIVPLAKFVGFLMVFHWHKCLCFGSSNISRRGSLGLLIVILSAKRSDFASISTTHVPGWTRRMSPADLLRASRSCASWCRVLGLDAELLMKVGQELCNVVPGW